MLCMAGVKISRIIKTPKHTDSWVDLTAYGAIGGDITDESNNRESVQGKKRGRPRSK